ncbi:MAG: threonine synthase, partial [Clostridia bacterium]|nr:threonine synthase [Clostridia bacterium]
RETLILELFRGPTAAFKDMALQILPYLLTASAGKNGVEDRILILVATSGDTGKAALEGFADVEGTAVFVFYPADGVSPTQKLQMITQRGGNVGVAGVRGNFDDAQTGVKKIFGDEGFAALLKEKKVRLSSANSINWGRLVPQVVYYVSAYLDAVKLGTVAPGERLDTVVPTGNFGNILAAYIAKKMGVPLGKLISASNRNNVLADFIGTGAYDKNRPFYTTSSPAMDILISSNVERLLWFLADGDAAATAEKMRKLAESGRYVLSEKEKKALAADFLGGWAGEEESLAALGRVWREKGYLPDTHTAVALAVLEKLRREGKETGKTLVAATASPYKFSSSVLFALNGERREDGDPSEELHRLTGIPVPMPLRDLDKREIRFGGTVSKEEMRVPVLALAEGGAEAK